MAQTGGILHIGSAKINCTSLTYSPGAVMLAKDGGGYAYAKGMNSLSAVPTMTFTTTDVVTAIGAIGENGTSLASANATAYIQNSSAEGVRAGTATRYVAAKGLVVIDSVTLSLGGMATVSGTIHAVSSDGTADPWTVTDGVAMPTISLNAACSTLGLATLNGTAVGYVTNVTINYGCDVQKLTSNGRYFPTFSNLMSAKPTISVTSTDTATVRALVGRKGLKLTGTGIVVSSYGTTDGVMNSTQDNSWAIKLGLAHVTDDSAPDGSFGNISFTVEAAWDGSQSNPLQVS